MADVYMHNTPQRSGPAKGVPAQSMNLRELIAKDMAGEPLSDEQRQFLEAEAARRTQSAGAAPGGETPSPAQAMPEQASGGAGLGEAFMALAGMIPNRPPAAIGGDALSAVSEQVAPAITGLGETMRGEVPPGRESTPEFAPMRFNPMMGFAGPDMPLTDRLMLAAGAAADRRPEAQVDMAVNRLGEDRVSRREDALGNLLLDIDGQEMYVNRPGFTPADARDVAADAAAFSPAGKVANIFARGVAQAPTTASKAGRWLGGLLSTGGTAAATEAVRQGPLGEVFGSDQGMDPADIAIAGATANLGEQLLPGLRRWTPEARQALDEAEGLGVNLRGGPGEQVLQTRAAAHDAGSRFGEAGRLDPGQGRAASVGYTGFSDLQPRVREAQRTARAEADRLYDDPVAGARVRGQQAAVQSDQLSELSGSIRQQLDQVDIPAGGRTQQLFDEIDEAARLENGKIDLTSMEEWRQRVNSRLDVLGSPPDTAGRQEVRALNNAKREYDGFMDRQLAQEGIAGDQGALPAWREATKGWEEYVDRFKADDFIRTLTERREMNPTAIRNMLFNASDLPTSKKAADVSVDTVKRLNGIFGPDSREMQAIRAEVAADITAPLFGNSPDIGKFVDGFDKMLRKNRPLMETLWPENWEDGLELVRFAREISKRRGARAPGPLDPAVERMWNLANAWAVGHGLARGQARLNLSRGLIDKVREAGGGAIARKRLLHEMLGTDPTQRMIPAGVGAVAGPTAQNATDERNRTQESVGEQPAAEPDSQQAGQTDIRSLVRKSMENPEALTDRERAILQAEAQRRRGTRRED